VINSNGSENIVFTKKNRQTHQQTPLNTIHPHCAGGKNVTGTPVQKHKFIASICRVPTLLLTKNPGLSRTPIRNFPGPFWSPPMLKYKEKTIPSPS